MANLRVSDDFAENTRWTRSAGMRQPTSAKYGICMAVKDEVIEVRCVWNVLRVLHRLEKSSLGIFKISYEKKTCLETLIAQYHKMT